MDDMHPKQEESGEEISIPPIYEKDYTELITVTEHIITEVDIQSDDDFNKILVRLLLKFKQILSKLQENAAFIHTVSDDYDYSPDVKGNGYRTFVTIFHRALLKCSKVLKALNLNRSSWLAGEKERMEDFMIWSEALSSLLMMSENLIKMHERTEPGNLFTNHDYSIRYLDEVVSMMFKIPTGIFFGRCLGFQYQDSLASYMTLFNSVFVSSWDAYDSQSFIKTMLGIPNYLTNDDERAKKMEEIELLCDIKFLKFAMSIPENPFLVGLDKLCSASKCQVCHDITIPTDSIQLKGKETLHAPDGQIGKKEIICRLMAHGFHTGMSASVDRTDTIKPSDFLIIYIHGGAFIGMSHDVNIPHVRRLANETKAPIILLDYTYATEAVYPRQIDELFFAYCWILQNLETLGTTGKHIVVYAESAGATLTVCLTGRCIEAGIRAPDGLLLVHGLFQLYPTCPSQIISIMDPIVPSKLIMHCVYGYMGIAGENQEEKTHPDPFMSPLLLNEKIYAKFPKVSLITTDMDPCLDDNVSLAKKLNSAGRPPTLDILLGLPHCFCIFRSLSQEAKEGQELFIQRLKTLLEQVKEGSDLKTATTDNETPKHILVDEGKVDDSNKNTSSKETNTSSGDTKSNNEDGVEKMDKVKVEKETPDHKATHNKIIKVKQENEVTEATGDRTEETESNDESSEDTEGENKY